MATIIPAQTITPRAEVIVLDPNAHLSIFDILADLERGVISHDEAQARIVTARATADKHLVASYKADRLAAHRDAFRALVSDTADQL